MNKSKIILAATGGVVTLAVLVMAYFTWRAFSAKTAAIEGDADEGTDGLETVVAKAETLSRKSVYPCAASVKAVESNEAVVVAWLDEARRLAARGDRAYRPRTASEFKSFIEQDAKRLTELPGGVAGKLLKKGFEFGPFKDYLIDGKMPAEDPVRIAELQRAWDDVSSLFEVLSTAGACEVLNVTRPVAVAEPKPEAGRRANAPKAKKAAQKVAAPEKKDPSRCTYVVSFTTRPAGLVKALNALATGERFTVVDDFGFVREKDAIAEALGGSDAQKQQQTANTGRRRRRGAVAQVIEQEEKPSDKGRVVTDPLLDAPIKVEMTVSVYDFRSLEEEGEKK